MPTGLTLVLWAWLTFIVKFVVLCEPPYTERYVRWWEGMVDKLIIYLLLDFNSLLFNIFLKDQLVYTVILLR